MSQPTLSRELALRIGLAAKALPDTRPEELIKVLIACLGFPLVEAKLGRLSKDRYRRALNAVLSKTFPADSLDESLTLLREADRVKPGPPRPMIYRPEEMPHSIRVAVASREGAYVDGPFSLCKQFYIYQVSARERRLIAIRPAAAEDAMKAGEKQTYRAEIIQDCQVLYSQSIGGPAAAKVIKQGVHPIKVAAGAAVNEVLEQLQHVLSNSPPRWLVKRMDTAGESLTPISQESSI